MEAKTTNMHARERAERRREASSLGKKTLSVFMAIVLAVGLMPLPAFGDNGQVTGVSFNGHTASLTAGVIAPQDNSAQNQAGDSPEGSAESDAPAGETPAASGDVLNGASVGSVMDVVEVVEDAVVAVPDDVAAMDFSTQRIIVSLAAGDIEARDRDNVVSEGDGMYLLQYKNVESTQKAYVRYTSCADLDFVAPDIIVKAADDTIHSTDVNATDPVDSLIANLQTGTSSGDGNANEGAIKVALVDSGAPANSGNVYRYDKTFGTKTYDDAGHGTIMLNTMVKENPGVQVFSIKALDSSASGTAATVSKGIRMAADEGADIINLSFAGDSQVEGNAAINEAVRYAVDEKHATVIAAAGNDGADASLYTPANERVAFTVGSAADDGKRQPKSNYGDVVDAYVKASSTSRAAARTSGWLSLNYQDGWQDKLKESDLYGPYAATEVSPSATVTGQDNVCIIVLHGGSDLTATYEVPVGTQFTFPDKSGAETQSNTTGGT
ncbi:MAG: S8 family serine peptidase, partial [Eggerthellaceae bacterium]|nr:S8 family serine peptidase [Eggerthellaceae bacterium]